MNGAACAGLIISASPEMIRAYRPNRMRMLVLKVVSLREIWTKAPATPGKAAGRIIKQYRKCGTNVPSAGVRYPLPRAIMFILRRLLSVTRMRVMMVSSVIR